MIRHTPVLLKESIEGLQINPGGIYVDVTFGSGGHSREILKNLKSGKLYAFDQDEDAIKDVALDKSVVLIHKNFRNLKNSLNKLGIEEVDGVLADLGVSSHQLDSKERGFSTRFNGLLDMRMNRSVRLTGGYIINNYSEKELKMLFFNYGEIRNSSRLSALIVRAREHKKITTVNQIKEVIAPCVPKQKENKYYAQVFQALRIEVNNELNVLKEMLMQCAEVIKPGGRLVVIAYHSLEDRLVKNFMRSGNFSGEVNKDIYGNPIVPFKVINKKPISPGMEEVKKNNRARSGKLRIAEKL